MAIFSKPNVNVKRGNVNNPKVSGNATKPSNNNRNNMSAWQRNRENKVDAKHAKRMAEIEAMKKDASTLRKTRLEQEKTRRAVLITNSVGTQVNGLAGIAGSTWNKPTSASVLNDHDKAPEPVSEGDNKEGDVIHG